MSATQQVKRNPFKRWVAVDLLLIVIFLTVALVVGLIKRESPDIWTGLYILGLIPLILSDLKKDLEEGMSDTEVALKKWKAILDALRAIEEVSIQITSFCLKHQEMGCKNCPILKYDYPCGHPYATFTIFYQELKKLRIK